MILCAEGLGERDRSWRGCFSAQLLFRYLIIEKCGNRFSPLNPRRFNIAAIANAPPIFSPFPFSFMKTRRNVALDRIRALDDESLELRVKVFEMRPINIHSLFMPIIKIRSCAYTTIRICGLPWSCSN